MKVDNQIVGLEVFYNNEKLLLVSARSPSESIVYIVNTQTKKVMNIVKQPGNPGSEMSYVTITLLKKPPEIYLVGFGENQLAYCDIDDKQLNKVITSDSPEAFHLKSNLPAKNKLVKLLGYNPLGNVMAIGLCVEGIMLFTLGNK